MWWIHRARGFLTGYPACLCSVVKLPDSPTLDFLGLSSQLLACLGLVYGCKLVLHLTGLWQGDMFQLSAGSRLWSVTIIKVGYTDFFLCNFSSFLVFSSSWKNETIMFAGKSFPLLSRRKLTIHLPSMHPLHVFFPSHNCRQLCFP